MHIILGMGSNTCWVIYFMCTALCQLQAAAVTVAALRDTFLRENYISHSHCLVKYGISGTIISACHLTSDICQANCALW